VLKCAEFEHCEQPGVHYFIGIDTSYSETDGNAMCAALVIKATPTQKDGSMRLLREVVNVFDFPPPPGSDQAQALIYKKLYHDYTPKTIPQTGITLLCVDAYVSGDSIIAELMKDLGDGLPPLKCVNGWKKELELSNAVPAILPIRATGGSAEQEYITLENASLTVSDMILVADIRREFTNRNIHLLIPNENEGVAAYNKKHQIKDTYNKNAGGKVLHVDSQTAWPYIKTREMVGQIRNLKVIGGKEHRIKVRMNRDMFSAMKYANRGVTILEKQLYRPRALAPKPPARAYEPVRYSNSRLKTSHGGKRY
jgi:hypothetical protein